ncbi:MAG TPA: diaminopimelate decarboxylase [Pyrinomonadaceae bacterium]
MTQTWEIENYLEVRNDQLYVDGVSAVELARGHGTPLFVYSERRIRRNIDRLKKSGDVIDCPLKLCYAAKAMSTMGILRAVQDADCDIEVNSGGELWKALEIGFRRDQIIFNGTSKEIWELEMAINAEIYAIQVDSPVELAMIETAAKQLGKPANVSLRLVPEIESATHHGLQTALLTSKFGMMPDEARECFRQYKDSPHLNLAGLHLHIGSQNPDPSAYTEAFEVLFSNLRAIYEETGIKLSHINLGGGFPVDYISGDETAEQFSENRREMFEADFEPENAISNAWTTVKRAAETVNALPLLDGITLLLEPGRSIIADAGVLLTCVRNIKKRPTAQPTANRQLPTDAWILTDAGFNLLLSMATYHWYYHLISASRASAAHDFTYKVAGPLCDGGDVYFDVEAEGRLPDYRLLPENIQIGEVLALLNAGAYTLSQASQYNARFLPAVVLIKNDGKAELIRRKDKFADLISSDIW